VKSVRAVEGKDTDSSRIANCNCRATLWRRHMNALCGFIRLIWQNLDTRRWNFGDFNLVSAVGIEPALLSACLFLKSPFEDCEN
jgi:hypothetical protein